MNNQTYDINDIDEYGALKPGFGIWLAAIILSRQLFYAPLMKLVSRKGRGGSGATVDLSFVHIYSYWEIIACLPSLAVIVLLFLRRPDAGATTRSLWKQTRHLLLVGALAQVLTLTFLMFTRGLDNLAILVQLLLCIFLLYYAFASKRLSDVVKEFPTRK